MLGWELVPLNNFEKEKEKTVFLNTVKSVKFRLKAKEKENKELKQVHIFSMIKSDPYENNEKLTSLPKYHNVKVETLLGDEGFIIEYSINQTDSYQEEKCIFKNKLVQNFSIIVKGYCKDEFHEDFLKDNPSIGYSNWKDAQIVQFTFKVSEKEQKEAEELEKKRMAKKKALEKERNEADEALKSLLEEEKENEKNNKKSKKKNKRRKKKK